MGDLLIRDVPDAMKRQLQESAQRNGRSLSEEAIEIMRRQIAVERSRDSAGQRLRSLMSEERLSEDEVEAIAASRHERDREPPRFDT
ncbi:MULTISPECIES: FitA-like ribbon-helix-helix domain-containing protein [Rhizobium]|jgi:plasmid stability protein|uniref:Putative plasmid stabilization protein n=1 Tax=Rhizobium leguminosarum bv. trifolii (strain WSM1325) TaxID=395491 RepID=C6AZ58_RHILS|nr:plasmid stabilization protein [Rhizobium leguminosarum]ACS54384.1 putative plasmid stabilization protein [Rhizobium leguminosarum bv. trifolii WSM1325]MBY2911842.1 plasmid stabilization protein [Rhizobium leguminosarum]MBY2914267.1 plasmid stabilization protein [Rhizobium leguminosarum]MBY2919899.1 plasmid stabilization protein [Rhizobium leguminosarum]MBY2932294.1 plasmid stabilization protein [Rhizobium leguminosarum]